MSVWSEDRLLAEVLASSCCHCDLGERAAGCYIGAVLSWQLLARAWCVCEAGSNRRGGVLVDGVSFEYFDFLRALWSVSCCALNLCSASTTVGARFHFELPAVSLIAHTCRGSDRRTCAFEFTRTRGRSVGFVRFWWNEVSFGVVFVGSQRSHSSAWRVPFLRFLAVPGQKNETSFSAIASGERAKGGGTQRRGSWSSPKVQPKSTFPCQQAHRDHKATMILNEHISRTRLVQLFLSKSISRRR